MNMLTSALVASALACTALAAAAPVASAEIVYVHRGPPPLRHEVIIARPGPADRYFWRPGFWRWERNDYLWTPGVWIERPRARAAWVPGHWVHRHRGWVFIDGHWR